VSEDRGEAADGSSREAETGSGPQRDDELGRAIGDLAGGRQSVAGGLARASHLAVESMRTAGTRAVGSGRWLAEALIDAAPRVPVRDLALLRQQHPTLGPSELAETLIQNASRVTAGMGAAAGALIAAEEFSPPSWLVIPIELVVETLAIGAVEMKLIAELHEVYGRPVPGRGRDRGLLLARAWAEGRGVSAAALATPAGMSALLSVGARRQAVQLVRRRVIRRTARSLTALAPFLAGAVAGAEINRRGTRTLAAAVLRDLATP
jgi:hypothetical protein